jgi:predicted amino acid-binding ACT domain protein
MALKVERMDMWVGGMKDKAGELAAILAALAEAGVNLSFVMARRAPDKPGTGVVFSAPVKGAAQARAAKKAGLHKSKSLVAIRVEGSDKKGEGARITTALAQKGINLRGLSAAAIGRKFVAHIALDSSADATKAARVLRGL